MSLVGLFLFIKTKKSLNFENGFETSRLKNGDLIVKKKMINFFDKFGFVFFSIHAPVFGRNRLDVLKPSELSTIKEGIRHIKDYYSLIKAQLSPLWTTPLGVSTQAFVSAYYSDMMDDPKLILSVTALESLFSISSQELTHRLCHNISFFMYPNNKDIEKRMAMYKRVKSVYNSRSKLVHGDSVELNNEELDDALYIYCEVIQKIIEGDNIAPVFLDKVIHKRWIKYLELGYFIKDFQYLEHTKT